MKKFLLLAVAAVVAAGCSNVVSKHFRVFTEPAGSDISVVSGVELKEMKYRSPASITAEVPKDPALAARAVMEVRKDDYKPRTIALAEIHDGDTLNLKFDRILRDVVKYQLSFRMARPMPSPDLRFRDKVIDLSLFVADQSFRMNVKNVSSHDMKILWDRAQYTDVDNRTHRIMPAGIVRYQDRNNPPADQYVLAGESVRLTVVPVDNVYVSPRTRNYDVRPLFPLMSDAAAGLKGKSFYLFFPVESDRQIIPYGFKIEITGAKKEIVKE
jgi:hypothetical protein